MLDFEIERPYIYCTLRSCLAGFWGKEENQGGLFRGRQSAIFFRGFASERLRFRRIATDLVSDYLESRIMVFALSWFTAG
jgi:hypothetical protein